MLQQLEEALDAVGRYSGAGGRPAISEAKRPLREAGAGPVAAKLGCLSKGRNLQGHPVVGLMDDIMEAFDRGPRRCAKEESSGEASEPDAEGWVPDTQSMGDAEYGKTYDHVHGGAAQLFSIYAEEVREAAAQTDGGCFCTAP